MVRRTVELKNLEAGQEYNVQIRAIGDNENFTTSNWSTRLNFTADQDVVAPSAPTTANGDTDPLVTVEGDSFIARWIAPTTNDDATPVVDLKDYEVTVTNLDNSATAVYYTANTTFEFTDDLNRAAFGTFASGVTGVPNFLADNIQISVKSRDLGNNTSATPRVGSAQNGAPGAFTLTNNNSTAPLTSSISWDIPSGDDILVYRVRRGITTNTYTVNKVVTDTAFTETNLAEGDYFYRVQAYDKFGNMTETNEVQVTVVGTFEQVFAIPDTPTISNVSSTYNGDTQRARINFDVVGPTTADGGATNPYDTHAHYVVRWSTSPSGPFEYAIFAADNTTTDTVTIDNLDTNTTYYFGIKSVSEAGQSGAYQTDNTITAEDTTNPTAPSGAAGTGSLFNITVSWNPSTDPDHSYYQLYARQGSSMAGNPILNGTKIYEGNGTGFAHSVGDAETWYYQVRSVDVSGNIGAWSAETSATSTDSGVYGNFVYDPLGNPYTLQLVGGLAITTGDIDVANGDITTTGGNIIVGSTTTDNGVIKSNNFVGGLSGFQLDANGLLQAVDAQISGTLNVTGASTFGANITVANGFGIANDGAGALGTWAINGDGSASFSNVTLTGGSLTITDTDTFQVTSSGVLTATGANITGIIQATDGYLQNMNITGTLTVTTGLIEIISGGGGDPGRIEMDLSGIRMYDNTVAGNLILDLNIDTSTVALGSETTVTGTIRNAAAPNSRYELDGTGFRFYDDTNTQQFNLDTSTGDVSLDIFSLAPGESIGGTALANIPAGAAQWTADGDTVGMSWTVDINNDILVSTTANVTPDWGIFTLNVRDNDNNAYISIDFDQATAVANGDAIEFGIGLNLEYTSLGDITNGFLAYFDVDNAIGSNIPNLKVELWDNGVLVDSDSKYVSISTSQPGNLSVMTKGEIFEVYVDGNLKYEYFGNSISTNTQKHGLIYRSLTGVTNKRLFVYDDTNARMGQSSEPGAAQFRVDSRGSVFIGGDGTVGTPLKFAPTGAIEITSPVGNTTYITGGSASFGTQAIINSTGDAEFRSVEFGGASGIKIALGGVSKSGEKFLDYNTSTNKVETYSNGVAGPRFSNSGTDTGRIEGPYFGATTWTPVIDFLSTDSIATSKMSLGSYSSNIQMELTNGGVNFLEQFVRFSTDNSTNGFEIRRGLNATAAFRVFSNPASGSNMFIFESSDGTSRFNIRHDGPVYAVGGYSAPIGSAAAPPWHFDGDSNTGWYASSTNSGAWNFSSNGSSAWGISQNLSNSTGRIFADTSASQTTPTYSFSGATGTGIYRDSSGNFCVTVDGTQIVRSSVNDWVCETPQVLFQSGAASAPGIAFEADQASGFRWDQTNQRLYAVESGLNSLLMVRTAVVPGTTGATHNLGNSTFLWEDVWAVDTTINSSDIAGKESVIDTPHGLDFVKAMKPRQFVRKGRSRPHHGFVAQEVRAQLDALGVADFAGYIDPAVNPPDPEKWPEAYDENGNLIDKKGLRMGEFIAPLYKAVQELSDALDEAKSRITQLEAGNRP